MASAQGRVPGPAVRLLLRGLTQAAGNSWLDVAVGRFGVVVGGSWWYSFPGRKFQSHPTVPLERLIEF